VSSRLERERGFFNHLQEDGRKVTAKYYSISRSSTEAYETLLQSHASKARVLEIGCGMGEMAMRLARQAAHVDAIDLSKTRVAAALHRAASMKLANIDFHVMNAETLAFNDNEFDLVCGQAILHHLDMRRAFSEVARVLKPSGYAVFVEPLGHNPVINLYRRLTPRLRTPDEHPLRLHDLAVAESYFEHIDARFFHLTSFAAVPFAGFPWVDRLVDRLDALDRRLLGEGRFAARFAWRAVINLRTPRRPESTSSTSRIGSVD
jgi:ubiquinone/menaquinone biosynthesis C-methylase UbiE